VCYWDTATGKLVRQLENVLPKMRHSLLSQDGRLVAVMPWDNGPISVWDTETGKQRCAIPQDEKEFRAPRYFSRDSRTLLTNHRTPNGEDTVVSFWDTETGKLLRRLALPEPASDLVLLSPDEKTLLTHSDGIVHLRDTVTGKPRIQYPGHESIVGSLAFTRDGKRLVSGARDGDIRVWNAATGKSELAIKSHKWGVLSSALTQDDKLVLSGGDDGTVRLHELATGKERWRFDVGPPPEEQQRSQLLVYYLGIAPDGRSALTCTLKGNNDALMHKLDLETGKAVLRRPLAFTEFRTGSFSPDCRFIVGFRTRIFGPGESASDPKILEQIRGNGVFTLYEAATGRQVAAWGIPDFPGSYHRFTPDSRMIVNATWQRSASEAYQVIKMMTVRVRELASGKERLAIDVPVEGDAFNLAGLAVSDDGRTLAATRTDGILQLWDMASGKELVRRRAYGLSRALAFTPDGKRLASGHRDGTILIWDLSSEIDRRPTPPQADAKQVEQWWTALAGDDAKQAHAAIWGLIGAPERTLPLFRDRLRPAESPPAEKLKQLIGALDSEEFAKRNAANKELAKFEELAEPAMREALKEDVSAEKRKRLEKLVDITLIVRTPERLRQLRALEVLEQVGTPKARQFLAKLAQGTPEARQTREAKAALQRLERR
jgi:WD40 repeat protein